MDLRLEVAFSKTDLTDQIDSLKNRIDFARPLPQDVEDKVMQKLRLEWNYHSNAIEGNRLNYGETVAFLMTGITAKGKSLKDHLDIRGHNEAILFLLSIVKDERNFTEADIRALHQMILVEPYDSPARTSEGLSTKKRITLGEYKTSPNHVQTATGEMYYYASPEETPAKMQELMEWYKEAGVNKEIHPLILAALFHYKFVAIHPFDDGNGRLSRILMNLILMRNGFPPVVIKMEDRQVYYANLSQADTGNYFPFVEFIGDYLTASLNLYLKAIEGGDIDEPEDIDKEIALFKLTLQSEIQLKERKSNQIVERIIIEELDIFFKNLVQKVFQFEELFFKKSYIIEIKKKEFYRSDYENLNTKKFLEIITESDKKQAKDAEYKSLALQFFLENFKKINKNFSIVSNIIIHFNEYNYTFLDENFNEILTKLYHEKLSQQDQILITKYIITDLKNNIQKNL